MAHPLLRLLTTPFEEQKAALNEVQFFKGQPLAGRRQVLRHGGKMHLTKGLPALDKPVPSTNRLGNYFGKGRAVCQNLSQNFAEKRLIEGFRRRIDRQNTPRSLGAFG